MSGSHTEFPKKAVFAQLGLAGLVGIGFLFADKHPAHAVVEKEAKPVVVAAQKALAPIGKVEVKEEKTASAMRSGEDIYASTCNACHGNGIAGAPKLEDKAAWESRLSGGFTALVASAIKGKGGMPARGGDPDISDSEMELTVSHMIKKAGIELVAKSAANTSAPAESSDAVATAAVDAASAVAETTEETLPAADEPVAVAAAETVVEEAEAVVETVTDNASDAKEAVVEAVTEVKTEATAAVAAATGAAAVDHSKGEGVYKSSCFACHDAGVAGSPKFGDKAAWEPRIATGIDSLYTSALNGKGAMPAKGGNMGLSDDDIKAAVDYMAANAQ